MRNHTKINIRAVEFSRKWGNYFFRLFWPLAKQITIFRHYVICLFCAQVLSWSGTGSEGLARSGRILNPNTISWPFLSKLYPCSCNSSSVRDIWGYMIQNMEKKTSICSPKEPSELSFASDYHNLGNETDLSTAFEVIKSFGNQGLVKTKCFGTKLLQVILKL